MPAGSPIARLTLNAGARAEDNADFGTRVVPRAGAAYALRIAQGAFGDTRLRASYGQGIVEPRFDQSFGTDPCFPGNPNLLPEQSRTVHAGVEQKLASDRVRVTVDYFDNRFHDIISFGYRHAVARVPRCRNSSFGAGTYFNTDLARARGGNLSGEARLTRWLTPRRITPTIRRACSPRRTTSDLDPKYLGQSPAAAAGKLRQPHAECGIPADELEPFRLFHRPAHRQRFPGLGLTATPAMRASIWPVVQSGSRRQFLRAHRESCRQTISGCAGLSGARARVSHRHEIHDAP